VSDLVRRLLAQGFELRVIDEEGNQSERSGSFKYIMGELVGLEQATLRVVDLSKPKGQRTLGSVLIVYGNGADVIADYAVSLEPYIN
jgi:hypothetical protein